MNGTVIAIINNKGGSGKTATAVNMSHAIARAGKKVLIIDNDSQCNATSILLPHESIANSLYDLYDPDDPAVNVAECIYPTRYDRLFIIPNSASIGAVSIKILQQIFVGRNMNVLQILSDRMRKYVKKNFDFIVVDNPPSLDTYVVCALAMSDYVIIPNDSGSRTSFEGISRTAKFVTTIKEDYNSDLQFYKFLTVKLDRRTSISKRMHEQCLEYFGVERMFATPVPLNTDIQKAEEQHQTVYQQRSNSPAALAYMEIAKEVMEVLGNKGK